MWLLGVVLVAGILGWLALRWQPLPPGPWGLPIIGYLPWLHPSNPYTSLTQLARRYGPIYSLQLGSVYTVVLSDHRLVRQTLAKEVFTSRANLFLTHGIMQGYGLIVAEGERWKEQRKFAITSLKNFGMVKLGPKRNSMENRILDGVKEAVQELSGLESGQDCGQILLHCVGSVMNLLVLGRAWPQDDPTWKWLRELAEQGVKHIGVAGPLNFLPFLRWLPRYRRTLAYLLEGKEATHKLYMDLAGSGPPSLASLFLEEMAASRGGYFTHTQMCHFLADMWGAGVDTTLASLRWFLLYVAAHEDIQVRIQKEIDSVLGEREWPSLEDMPFLSYTRASIAETQRIRSVVPLGIPHSNKEETTIGDYKIPKGTMIVILQWAIHMNSEDWPQPEDFRPERFLDSESRFFKPEAFIPFQTGKRACIGEEMAHMMLFLFAAGILRQLSVAPEGDVSDAFQGDCGITLTPKPHRLIFTKRR